MKPNLNSKRSFGLLAIIFALPMLMMYQNCSKVGVSDIPDGVGVSQTGNPGTPGCAVGDPTCNNNPGGNPSNPAPTTCTTTLTVTTPVKVFFLVDVSGSNQSGQGNVSATDPSVLSSGSCKDKTALSSSTAPANCKPWRLGVLERFIGIGNSSYAANGYLGKAGFAFQVGVFQGSSASALIVNSSTNKTMFSSDATAVTGAVSNFLMAKDNDNTPYQAVLNMAASAIKQDISDNGGKPSKYVVVMLTDGMPTDANFSTGNPATNIANLRAAVADLANVAPGYITFNTALYYPSNGSIDPNAKSYLQNMAMAGSGNYVDSVVNASTIPFQIDNQVTVPTGAVGCPDGQN